MPRVVRPTDDRPKRKHGAPPRAVPDGKPAIGPDRRAEMNETDAEKKIAHLSLRLARVEMELENAQAEIQILKKGGNKEFYNVDEAAELWGVCRSTVQRMIRNEEIAAVQIGRQYRIPRAALMTGPIR